MHSRARTSTSTMSKVSATTTTSLMCLTYKQTWTTWMSETREYQALGAAVTRLKSLNFSSMPSYQQVRKPFAVSAFRCTLSHFHQRLCLSTSEDLWSRLTVRHKRYAGGQASRKIWTRRNGAFKWRRYLTMVNTQASTSKQPSRQPESRTSASCSRLSSKSQGTSSIQDWSTISKQAWLAGLPRVQDTSKSTSTQFSRTLIRTSSLLIRPSST